MWEVDEWKNACEFLYVCVWRLEVNFRWCSSVLHFGVWNGDVTGICCPLSRLCWLSSNPKWSVCFSLLSTEIARVWHRTPIQTCLFLIVLKVGSSGSMCFANRTVFLGHKSLCLGELVQILSATYSWTNSFQKEFSWKYLSSREIK